MSDTKQQTNTIEHLDFEAELACEHPDHESGLGGHDGSGWALVERLHGCQRPRMLVLCRGAWDFAGVHRGECHLCGHSFPGREAAWRVVEVLR